MMGNCQRLVEHFQEIYHQGWKNYTELHYLIIATMGELGELSENWKKFERFTNEWKGKKVNMEEAL